MIHGIYVKNVPNGRWHLISTSLSVEAAIQDKDAYLKKSKEDGVQYVDVAIQTFDSSFYIPEYLNNIKEQKLLYN